MEKVLDWRRWWWPRKIVQEVKRRGCGAGTNQPPRSIERSYHGGFVLTVNSQHDILRASHDESTFGWSSHVISWRLSSPGTRLRIEGCPVRVYQLMGCDQGLRIHYWEVNQGEEWQTDDYIYMWSMLRNSKLYICNGLIGSFHFSCPSSSAYNLEVAPIATTDGWNLFRPEALGL